ncbi:MAG: repeat domain protein [Labilithrix sp.]|nr:repeat domain protein [Labilithrix sp.]
MRLAPVALLVLGALPAAGCKGHKPPAMSRVWLGAYHGCATLAAGELECWGAGDHGQLGNGEKAQSLLPVSATEVPAAPKELALGRSHSCGLYEDGRVTCWGRTKTPALPPVARVTTIGAAGDRTCAVQDGQVLCWDDAHPAPVALPGLVLAGEAASLVAVGTDRVCASIASPGRVVRCVGNAGGPARTLLAGAALTMLTAGGGHACALLDDGSARCWGDNTHGQIGDGTTVTAAEPALVSGLPRAVEIHAGGQFTCARLHDNTVACWGDNDHHQLANGTTQAVARPAPVQGLTGVLELAVGATSACGRLAEGGARCWGDNQAGQLGDGSTAEHDVPMPVRSQARRH